MLMMSPPTITSTSANNNNINNNNINNANNTSATAVTKSNNTSGTSETIVSSSLNSSIEKTITLTTNTNSQQDTQQLNSVYMVPTVPSSFSYSQNAIRKRKVKFTVQLAIQELLSVPYLNAVLFCKVRQCDGGNHVSYSSKKEVSNSSVIWSDDAPIQFDVKTVQSYATATTTTNGSQSVVVIGYDQSLCRISVRKELRGGKSYQKIGYVDYNLVDFISKYHETLNGPNPENEFCVNRILKEYDSASSSSSSASKKNQQRLDNSYLKIKIKIFETNLLANQINIAIGQPLNLAPPSPPVLAETNSNSTPSSLLTSTSTTTNSNTNSIASATIALSPTSNQSPSLHMKSTASNPTSTNSTNQNYTPTHSRHSSTSTCNSILINNNSLNNSSLSSVFVNGHYRSCSNGSIQSNVSLEYNRTKKLLEELHSTSSSSSLTALISNQLNQYTDYPNGPQLTPTSSLLNKIEPANLLVQSRIDVDEVCNQIENELINRLTVLKSSSASAATQND